MPRRIVLCLAFMACVILGGSAFADTKAIIAKAFDDIGADQPGCAVATVRDQGTDFAAGYGLADIAEKRAIGPDTLFEAASLSKQLAAFTILLLEKQHKLSLGDSVRKYIPELGEYAQEITIRDLVYHTSGIRDAVAILSLQDNPATTQEHEKWSDNAIISALARQRGAETPPHTKELYSNTGYRLLAIIAQRASGEPFQALLAESVFGPLGMTSTFVGDADPVRLRTLAQSYRPSQSGFQALPLSPPFLGAGSVRTTANDMSRWIRNFWTGRVGGLDLMRKMAMTVPLPNGEYVSYAAGLIRLDSAGPLRLEHGGSIDGFRHRLVVFPGKRFGAVVLCNRTDAAVPPRIDAIAHAYVKVPQEIPADIRHLQSSKNIDASKARTGMYRDTTSADYAQVRHEGGRTIVQYRGEDLPIAPVAPNIYQTKDLSAFPGFAIYVAFDERGMRMTSSGDFDDYEAVEEWHPGDLSRWAGTYWSEEAQAHLKLVSRDGALYAEIGSLKEQLRPGREGEFIFRRGGLVVPANDAPDRVVLHVLGLRGIVFSRNDSSK